ncbi:MAG: hypothetical protein HYV09_40045 [Deltaproteobacteria bacterium]|nr:hypothetical protein [Deltaproteobacteria bacterium]
MRSTLAVLLCVIAAGCGGMTSTPLESDAGADATRDATPGVDAGPGVDATPGVDASTGDAILPPVDVGDPFGDAGPLGTPPWVPVEVRTSSSKCTPLAPCGGAVVGTWDVAGICVDLEIDERFFTCPGAKVLSAGGRARGRVVFTASTARRIGQSEVLVDLFLPSYCAAAVGGCGKVEAQIKATNPDAACVTAAAGDCTCQVRRVTSIDEYGGYAISSSEIVATTGTKRWAYCVAGTALKYEDVSPSGPKEPGIVTLGRR